MNNSKTVANDHSKRIDKVLNHILAHFNEDVSLEELARIANYSPFHFQKLFKQEIGQTPKQYIIKLKLETALHLMIIHQRKSLFEISIDCGFSSPAVFSRSFKNYFGISPDEMREMNPERRKMIRQKKNKTINEIDNHLLNEKSDKNKEIKIQVKKINSRKCIYLIAPFGDMIKIQQSFKKLFQLADVNDIPFDQNASGGILSPHQGGYYKAFIEVERSQKIPESINCSEIKGGKYACFKVTGDLKNTLEASKYFFHDWLPESGYKIADIVGFETFSENPNVKSYEKIVREIHVPIEPA